MGWSNSNALYEGKQIECYPHIPHVYRKTGALILEINRTQPATMASPDTYVYFNEWNRGNRLTLGLNTAENTDYMKKKFQIKVVEISISSKKTQCERMSIFYHPWGGAELRGSKNWYWLKYYNAQKWQITFTLGLNTVKNTDYMEKKLQAKVV